MSERRLDRNVKRENTLDGVLFGVHDTMAFGLYGSRYQHTVYAVCGIGYSGY